MFSFHYEININDQGRLYISPVNGSENELSAPEHKFMAIEMTLGFVSSMINSALKSGSRTISDLDLQRLQSLESDLLNFSTVISPAIQERFEMIGLADKMINKTFHIPVFTEAERDELNYNGIIYHDQIYNRHEGLRVKVLNTGEIFELVGGVDNIHWQKI
jgi:hypothetical protein